MHHGLATRQVRHPGCEVRAKFHVRDVVAGAIDTGEREPDELDTGKTLPADLTKGDQPWPKISNS